MEQFFAQYGPWVMLIYLVVRDGFPLVAKTFLPAKLKQDEEERIWRHSVEERQIAAQEGTKQAVQQMSLAVTVGNERLNALQSMMVEHSRITAENNSMLQTRLPRRAKTRSTDVKPE